MPCAYQVRIIHRLPGIAGMYVDRIVLKYASIVWESYLKKHINALEKVQKQFTNRIPSLANLSHPERLAALDLEPLELRRFKSDFVLYYKRLHDLVALHSSEYFTMSYFTSQTRTGGCSVLYVLY